MNKEMSGLEQLRIKKQRMMKVFIVYAAIMLIPIAIVIYMFVSDLRMK